MDPSEGRFYREAFPSLCDFYLQADHCETSFNLFLNPTPWRFQPIPTPLRRFSADDSVRRFEDSFSVSQFSLGGRREPDNESRNILRKLKRRNWHSFLLKSFDSSKYTFAYVEQCAWYFEWKCTKNAVGSNFDSTSRRYRKFGVWNGRGKSKSGTRTIQPWKKRACQVAPRWYLQASGHVHGALGFHSAVTRVTHVQNDLPERAKWSPTNVQSTQIRDYFRNLRLDCLNEAVNGELIT